MTLFAYTRLYLKFLCSKTNWKEYALWNWSELLLSKHGLRLLCGAVLSLSIDPYNKNSLGCFICNIIAMSLVECFSVFHYFYNLKLDQCRARFLNLNLLKL